jgi:hypothetical protein
VNNAFLASLIVERENEVIMQVGSGLVYLESVDLHPFILYGELLWTIPNTLIPFVTSSFMSISLDFRTISSVLWEEPSR